MSRLIDAGMLDLESVEEASSDQADRRFVYLLQSGSLYKIGYAKNINHRLSAINTGSPQPVTLVDAILTSQYTYLEQHLHERFSAKRTRGEWFALDVHDVAAFRAARRIPAAILY